MIVAISFEKEVNFFEKYDKLYGAYFADFVRINFRTMFRKSGKKYSKLFVQDNCPILNWRDAVTSIKSLLTIEGMGA